MEKWNELCYTLSENISSNLSEELFELKVIQALGVLGWKEFKGDLKIRKPFQVGASKKLIPDIVVISDNEYSFVIEVKKPAIPITKEFRSQLKSYMRQLRLDYGILIGQKIQIFYDGTKYNTTDFTLIEEIDFKRDSNQGMKFVELFKKENYSQEGIESYIQTKLNILEEKRIVKRIKTELLSDKYNDLFKNFILQELQEKYKISLVERALGDIGIKITDSSLRPIEKQKTTHRVQKDIKSKKINHFETIPDLKHTKIIKGIIEGQTANNWQNLLRLIVKTLLSKGISSKEIMNNSRLNIGVLENNGKSGFHLIKDTEYTLQNVDANIAGNEIVKLSKIYDIDYNIKFKWRDKEDAVRPNEYGELNNVLQ